MPRGDEKVEALFEEFYAPLTGLAYVILGDRGRAEEAVMDSFVKALSPRWKRRRIDNPGAYLRMIVVNECRSRIRRATVERKAVERSNDREPLLDAPSMLHLDVWSEVRKLPERQRICVVLFYAEDMTVRSIAETLDCSEGTVKSQLAKARAKLSTWLSSLKEEVS